MRIDRLENGGRCVLRLRGALFLEDARGLFERALVEDCGRVALHFGGGARWRIGAGRAPRPTCPSPSGLRDRQVRLLEYLGATRTLGA